MPSYKRVCPRAAIASAGWPHPTVPVGAAPTGCCPCERRRPPLRGAAPASGAGLPYRLALAVARPWVADLACGLAAPPPRWRSYIYILDPDGEDGGQASSSLALSTRWISVAKLLISDLATLAQREGGE
ncbi:hypothetical protein B296_00002482 [Ensete ventricosum]|uniref:Uncharacterized protein n=1 Tax=Ensete ventricosum TaxID=4639 RepID=A0A426ZG39_ENSVE|nr:hypothetical protein B296_00002482 [Ensete ventricosum]